MPKSIHQMTKDELKSIVTAQAESIRQLNESVRLLKGFNESLARQLNHIRDYHKRLNSAITEVTTAEELSS